MDLDRRIFTLGSGIGLILMLASFIAYVNDPSSTYTLLFAIGLVLLCGGYVLVFMENHRYRAEYFRGVEQQERDGMFIVLDEDYVPYDNPATIEDLRDM